MGKQVNIFFDTIQNKTKLDLLNFKVWKNATCNQADAAVQLIRR